MATTSRLRPFHSVRSSFYLYIDGNVRVQDLAMTALRFTSIIGRICLISVPLFLTLATIYAGSANWNLNPTTGDWNVAANWTPAAVPNGVSDIATFGMSNTTHVSLSATTDLDSIIFE